ncbi:MAG: DnaJ-class molecular chaperone CbpA [Candidatus Magasanikbacteria bacterium GW2011_GWD2_43_18]|uniref:DnaJ-class molecular chaperone CbpA n=1 Tax=Candidatus Magasanikbacteria bacterium GW2011_GWE2_42_7 TaxID=1619052 RepID=A0A0G1BB08_9BACT|nr:MAG: DnaJ-class molecular chaperone CbpA [Candidatus Magasanikbacteria bacterium GW2011_GWC2_42_27]KKS70384.1 MAG: DnaJ-class molecular chaperone CbpA [Candidatus Magasanikbacteria bacterium GW2011_GWE2_42_7]KKT04600.1 MAG: DnaJ-class molecular chaperone CbpA [Candidatus Magasanikbacteria bacterium GW2011_GWD2_43_18]KKT24440.1 MAG: DnaJ-class molecular chaperone CbpA [Candidatus Magasanikbacteria bacterium GW2011_GWA2_43_9]HBB38146.1 hypothetical protein [Candidatus Magasanikbacteria bacteri
MSTSHYDALGVPKDASIEEIKRAYRKVAMENHPDRNTDENAQARFQAAAEAYAILSDPEKRRTYDSGFRRVRSVQDLFSRVHLGQKLVAAMLPKAPAAPRDGVDSLITVKVSEETIRDGGIVEVRAPRDPDHSFVIHLEPGYRWCRVTGMGEPGQRGGTSGDLYIHFADSAGV